MSIPRTTKAFLRNLIDAGKLPAVHLARGMRPLAVLAALVSLGACMTPIDYEPPSSRGDAAAAAARADGFADDLCIAVGAEPGCDLCGEAGEGGAAGYCCTEGIPYPPGTVMSGFICSDDGQWLWSNGGDTVLGGEIDCTNGLDDDGDGAFECEDSDCREDPICQNADPAACYSRGIPYAPGTVISDFVCADGRWLPGGGSLPAEETDCGNGVDDDGDGDGDCADSDCAADPACDASAPAQCYANGEPYPTGTVIDGFVCMPDGTWEKI